jgi:hypothetical protein
MVLTSAPGPGADAPSSEGGQGHQVPSDAAVLQQEGGARLQPKRNHCRGQKRIIKENIAAKWIMSRKIHPSDFRWADAPNVRAIGSAGEVDVFAGPRVIGEHPLWLVAGRHPLIVRRAGLRGLVRRSPGRSAWGIHGGSVPWGGLFHPHCRRDGYRGFLSRNGSAIFPRSCRHH